MITKKLLDDQIYTHILTTDKKLIPRYKHDLKEMECGDCGAEYGMYHMINCDQEKCPVCGGQMFGCDCWQSYNFIEKIKVKVCETTVSKAIILLESDSIDIAEYESEDGFYKYCIKKECNEIVFYTKNTDEVVFSDKVTCYAFMAEEESEEYKMMKDKENDIACCGDCRVCEKCKDLNIPPMEELDKIFGALAKNHKSKN